MTNAPDVEERLGVTGRVSFAPILTDSTKVHLAPSARYRDHGDEAAFNYAGRPNTNFGTTATSTPAPSATRDTTWAAEGAAVFNNLRSRASTRTSTSSACRAGSSCAGGDPT